jgi:CheY-like chemotaxis protein
VVRIAQVIANLLNNAARYTDAGGVITIAATEREKFAVVSVRDNGIGIDPEMLARIFEMFAQADHDHKRAQGGLGIGLALAKALVEMHGGRIEAHSRGLGLGSEFKIWLPLARGAVEPRPGAEKVQPASSRRILVVDDNHDAAKGLSLLLEQLGNEVRTATNGPAALELLDTFHPAFVILDLGMPGMSGYEVATRIRQRADAADIRLVALTGWAQEEDRRRTAEAGFHYHLVKPVDLDALFGVLAEELPCQAPAAG